MLEHIRFFLRNLAITLLVGVVIGGVVRLIGFPYILSKPPERLHFLAELPKDAAPLVEKSLENTYKLSNEAARLAHPITDFSSLEGIEEVIKGYHCPSERSCTLKLYIERRDLDPLYAEFRLSMEYASDTRVFRLYQMDYSSLEVSEGMLVGDFVLIANDVFAAEYVWPVFLGGMAAILTFLIVGWENANKRRDETREMWST